jgi:hypothetical protein
MITFKNLEKRNYDTKSISNYELCGKCVKCNKKFTYSCVKKFIRNRINKTEKKHLWQTCSKCWLIINTKDDNNWIRKNSAAQKIAQNKPEQLKKNREGVRKSWNTKRREQASKTLIEKWKNDEAFVEKALSNLVHNGDNVEIGFGKGGLKGLYENIHYDSALELSFIIWCIRNNIGIRRYDKTPIEYWDEDGVHRKYYPDFIINENDIVEIKGSGLWYRKNYNRNILKSTAAKKMFDSYIVVFEKDEAVRTYYRTARKIHNETYKKENN